MPAELAKIALRATKFLLAHRIAVKDRSTAVLTVDKAALAMRVHYPRLFQAVHGIEQFHELITGGISASRIPADFHHAALAARTLSSLPQRSLAYARLVANIMEAGANSVAALATEQPPTFDFELKPDFECMQLMLGSLSLTLTLHSLVNGLQYATLKMPRGGHCYDFDATELAHGTELKNGYRLVRLSPTTALGRSSFVSTVVRSVRSARGECDIRYEISAPQPALPGFVFLRATGGQAGRRLSIRMQSALQASDPSVIQPWARTLVSVFQRSGGKRSSDTYHFHFGVDGRLDGIEQGEARRQSTHYYPDEETAVRLAETLLGFHPQDHALFARASLEAFLGIGDDSPDLLKCLQFRPVGPRLI